MVENAELIAIIALGISLFIGGIGGGLCAGKLAQAQRVQRFAQRSKSSR